MRTSGKLRNPGETVVTSTRTRGKAPILPVPELLAAVGLGTYALDTRRRVGQHGSLTCTGHDSSPRPARDACYARGTGARLLVPPPDIPEVEQRRLKTSDLLRSQTNPRRDDGT